MLESSLPMPAPMVPPHRALTISSDLKKNSAPSLTVRRLSSAEEIEAAQRLRYKVWRAEGAVIHQPERLAIADSHDEHSMHWGAFDQEQLVGAARLCLHKQISEAPDAAMFAGHDIPAPVASLNRLVVLSEYRRQGIGSMLDEVRIEHAKQLCVSAIIVTPANVESRKRLLVSLAYDVSGFIST
jgi:GNAT superfamily N-acetyltransferase